MIGLALAGGGSKGSYEIGAYYAFKKCHIKFDGITGTSIGAVNAAMLASGRERELLKFWQNAETGAVLGFDDEYIEKVNSELSSKELINIKFQNLKKILKNKGIDPSGIENVLKKYDMETSLRNSKIDFGLCTFRMKDLKPLNLFLSDMPKGTVHNYIMSSCYLPVFKMKKLENDSYYFDGGIYDNLPYNMLLEKGYDKVYCISLKSIGLSKIPIDKSRVTIIEPSHKLSGVLSVNKEEVQKNIYYGYYDTLKVLKNLDGKKYIFKVRSDSYYKRILRYMPKRIKAALKVYLKCTSDKDMVIKLVEYILKKENMTYFNVYDVNRLLKKYKKYNKNTIIASGLKAIRPTFF